MANSIVVETVATLVGIFIGTLAALVIDRHSEQRRFRRRARTVLRALAQELDENHHVIKASKPAYVSTPWGKTFYISTASWETAMASGDLPHIIGFELTDSISAQYALYLRIRYYVDLLTQLWFSPSDVAGYEEIRRGFTRQILEAMSQSLSRHTAVAGEIERALRAY
jgi:uncharacterized membrane protein YccC